MTVVVPVDPVEVLLNWLRPILSGILPGWTAGARVAPNVTPSKFILIKQIGGTQAGQTAQRPTIVVQFWGDDGITDQHARVHASRVVFAQMQRAHRARMVSGPSPLQDPTNPERAITQITVTALLRGVNQ